MHVVILLLKKLKIMSNNRIQQLLDLLKEDPNDAFVHYGLFLEYLKKKDTINAEVYLENLWEKFPDYLPAYYQIAKYYESRGDGDYALKAYVKGIRLAKELKETHTLSELEREYEFLLDDMI